MLLSSDRGALVVTHDHGEAHVALTQPVDDALAVDWTIRKGLGGEEVEDEGERVRVRALSVAINVLAGGYLPFRPASVDVAPRRVIAFAEQLIRDHHRYRPAIREAQRGSLPFALEEALRSLKWESATSAVAPDHKSFDAVLAFTLVQLTFLGEEIRVRPCPSCKRPWLGSRGEADLCNRPMPRKRRTCREIAAAKKFERTHGDYRREYRRVWTLMRRGRITEMDWILWKTENGPDDWEPFEKKGDV